MRTLVLVLIVACSPVDRSSVRWPAHRKDRDARIEQLEQQVKVLQQHVEALERERPQPHEAAPAPPQS
jgi:hypothetical protein